MMVYAGLREGMYYRLGDGSQLLIKSYLKGQQAAQVYAQTFLAKECTGLQVTSNDARPDLAQTFGPKARAEGMPNAQLTAGDASVSCSMAGTTVHGKFMLATELPFPAQSGLWYVYRLYGYLAVPGRERDAERVASQAVQSIRANPQWLAQQRDQQETSDVIMKGWEQRNQVYDELSRRRENAILGTVDVVDPETGRAYKIDNYSDYHWMSNSGAIAGNNSGDAPGLDWRQLITLP